MFFTPENISETEKINYIYKTLRSEQRSRTFWLVIKLMILGMIIYGYYYLSLPTNITIRKEITTTIQAKVSEFIMPLVGSMVQDLTQNMLNPKTSSVFTHNKNKNISNNILPANITPEMIKAVQDALKK